MAAGTIKAEKLTGAQKAAVFLLAMGQEFTESFFKKLDERSIREIGKCMSEITYISSEILNAVMEEFLHGVEGDSNLVVSGRSFLEQVVSKSLDADTARDIVKSIGNEGARVPFGDLAYVPAEKLVNILRGEHPQTIALILSYLPEEKAAEALGHFEEEAKAEIALRIAQLGPVQEDVMRELDDILKKDISGMGAAVKKVDGVEKLASILNRCDGKTEESLLSHIEKEDGALAEVVRMKMFVFEDLLHVDDKSFREILQNIDKGTLVKALKTASEEMKTKIFSNLSERAAEMLKEDAEIMGPVKLRDVEKSQQDILKMAKKLEAEGRIVLGGKGKEDVVL